MESSASFIGSGEAVLLHGDLELRIIAAKNLPNMDLFTEHLRRCYHFCGFPFHRSPSTSDDHQSHSRGLAGDSRSVSPSKIITSDPYVKVLVAGATVAHTRIVTNSQDPVWNDHFKIPLAHTAASIEFQVKDRDIFGAQLIGTATISANLVASTEPLDVWLTILKPSGRQPMPDCMLHVYLRFVPVEGNPVYLHGIAGDPEKLGVTDTYFPVRKGGKVTLYQDAHVREKDLPEIRLDDGRVFRHDGCWQDMCQAMLEARHLIYIVGWSVHDNVRLVREPTLQLPEVGKLTLGELLKYKSREGVRVCLLVWDDKTSHDKSFLRMEGVMQTEDEKLKRYFKHSSVICVLAHRYPSSKLSMIMQQIVGTIFTHHQKCLLVDTEASQDRRKITAFLGGLDLCHGRYDTPQHRLFQDLDSVFHDDIYNPTFTSKKGPREPWHDLHCRIEGPAAYDVLLNFEQRWKKATKIRSWGQFFKFHMYDDAILEIDRIKWILSPLANDLDGDPNVRVSAEEDSETWHVQIFRSIDSGSVKWLPKSAQKAEVEFNALPKNLVCGKNLLIDKSIHTAYVKAIRSAKHFIYIENQYFLGSSYAWPSYQNPEANNLVPIELALKIISKIRARERFAVYIVIPMWPEGAPNSKPVQEILFWQSQTIKMMYALIAKELKSNKNGKTPQDYLNFYCLGTRELSDATLQSATQISDMQVSSQQHQRFMIYLHAKGMIVDDEYVILGSANINQRSLDGSRDTEIAMGAYQPHHTWAAKSTHPHGQVYGYRMSLWAEHLGELNEKIEEPHSLECVNYVNSLAEVNWFKYTSNARDERDERDERVKLKGHLLKYPLKVHKDGKVETLPGHESFPDVGGKVMGEPTALPDQVTM